MMDLNQLYTVLFCLWFLALGAIEYLVLRWVWRRWFSLERETEGRASVGATVVLFTVGARRQIEGPGEDAGKGLLRIEAILQADIVDPLIGVTQIAGGQQQLPFANIAPPVLSLYTVKTAVADAISNTRHGERYHQYAAVDAGVINPLDDSINHLSGNRHMLSSDTALALSATRR